MKHILLPWLSDMEHQSNQHWNFI